MGSTHAPFIIWVAAMVKLSKISLFQIFGIFCFIALFFVLFGAYTYFSFAQTLTSKDKILENNDRGVILLDRHNQPFFTLYQAKKRVFVPSSQIPDTVKKAAISSEDKDFYYHNGFSLRSITRSLWLDIQKREIVYGGSTITQQLIKNTLLNSRKNPFRKYQEVVLAGAVEQKYSKDAILEMYLNSVYFGEGAYGIEGASEVYFDKKAADLDLAQATLLVSLLPAPSKLSPITRDIDQAKIRQELILQKMVEQKYISENEKKAALTEQLSFAQPQQKDPQAVHFALMVENELVKKFGEDVLTRSGFKVKTSLDLDYQKYAQQQVKAQVEKLAVNHVTNGATVVENPKSGEILALVGSYDWYQPNFGKVNVATAPRQPGSTFKPIVYSAAFEKGLITPATILQDIPRSFVDQNSFAPPYKPQDYDRQFRGPVTARRALANSLNVPSVEVMSKVGVANSLEMAHRLGITTLDNSNYYGLALVLGAGEVKLLDLTNTYATFANNGVKNDPTLILEIKDKHNQVIYNYQPDPKPVLQPDIAFLISSIISDSKTRQEIFGNTLDISRIAAVKTGTSENYRDSWTIGYTPSLTIGSWVGNNDGTPMDNVAGSLGAAPIWKNLMEEFLKGTPVEQFSPPENIAFSSCTVKLSKEATSSAYSYKEYFIKGTQPQSCSPVTLTSQNH